MRPAIVLIALLLVSASVAATPPSVLITPFANATTWSDLDGLTEGIAELLTVCLSAYPEHVIVVDRSRLDAVIQEQSLAREDIVDSRSAASLGRLARAHYVLRGSFSAIDDLLHVQALLFDVETTRLAHSADAQLPLADVPSGVCDDLGFSVASYMSSANRASSQLAAAKRPEIQRHLIEGLGHYYNRNFAAAFPAFLTILNEDPDHAVAHYWLAMSFYQAGLEGLARMQFREFLRREPEGNKANEVGQLMEELAE